MMTNKIGIIAGGGQFPLLFTEAAQKEGYEVVVAAHRGETNDELEARADAFCWVKLGQLGKIIKFFHKQAVKRTVFLGTIQKPKIFTEAWPDLKGLSLWNKIDLKHDDTILRAIADTLEQDGIEVVESTLFLKDLLFPAGVISKKKPNQEQLDDITFGWKMAKEIGRLDIGQCLVVRNKVVLAVEAIEGTDATISRGGRLAGKNAVVVKVKKPNQDFRFDLPAIGAKTIETMVAVKAGVLAVECGQALLFDRMQVKKLVDRHGIVLLGLDQGVVDAHRK